MTAHTYTHPQAVKVYQEREVGVLRSSYRLNVALRSLNTSAPELASPQFPTFQIVFNLAS